jgi:hypothetical protein
MFKVTCLVDLRRTVGTPRKFDLESLRTTVRHNVTYCKQTQAITQQNATNMCYMNAQKERGSDSENFGTRITRFGVVVEKI